MQSDDGYDVHMKLREVVESHVLKVLAFYKGNKTRAANSLEVSVKFIYNLVTRGSKKNASKSDQEQ